MALAPRTENRRTSVRLSRTERRDAGSQIQQAHATRSVVRIAKSHEPHGAIAGGFDGVLVRRLNARLPDQSELMLDHLRVIRRLNIVSAMAAARASAMAKSRPTSSSTGCGPFPGTETADKGAPAGW